jgi:hypothetical protein
LLLVVLPHFVQIVNIHSVAEKFIHNEKKVGCSAFML